MKNMIYLVINHDVKNGSSVCGAFTSIINAREKAKTMAENAIKESEYTESEIIYKSYADMHEIIYQCKHVEIYEVQRVEVDKGVRKESFEISSLSREDVEHAGFEANGLSDGEMERIASKMGDAFCDQLYWTALGDICEMEGLKRNGDEI